MSSLSIPSPSALAPPGSIITLASFATGPVLHIDINAYFATMLQQENPKLRGRPLGIIKDEGRACIIAASKEAKLAGVKTGCLAGEARSRCPDLLLVPANFALCLSSTRHMRRLLRTIAPQVEIFSLDEAFIHLHDCQRLYPDPVQLGHDLQSAIKRELGDWVTCNVGLARNRLLAKMSGEVAPKGTVTVVTAHNETQLLATTPFRSVCGVGYRLEKRLAKWGATTPYMIRLLSDDILQADFGPYWSVELKKIAFGHEPAFLARGTAPFHAGQAGNQTGRMKSVGRSLTGYQPCDNEAAIKRVLYNLTSEVMHKARSLGLAGREVQVYLTDKHDHYWSDHRTLSDFIWRTDEMFSIIYHQMYQAWTRTFAVIKFGVRLSQLQPWTQVNPPIWPTWQQREKVAQAVDTLTQRYGLYMVRSGLLTKQDQVIQPEVTGFLGDQAYQFRDEVQ